MQEFVAAFDRDFQCLAAFSKREFIEFYQFVIKLGKLDEFLEKFSKKCLVRSLFEKVAKLT